MAEYTTNYSLYKPNRADSEAVDTTLSTNFSTIDTELKKNADDIATTQSDLDTKTADLQADIDSKTSTLQEQFDATVIEGDSSVEAAQARVRTVNGETTSFSVLVDRLNDTDAQTSQNEDQLQKIYGLSDLGVHYYVNWETGDDVNGDGTMEKPYKTIQKAFDSVPKVVNKRQTINIAPGVYDEECFLTGVIGGSIYVKTYGITPPDVSVDVAVRVKSMSFYDVMGYINVADIGQATTTPTISRDGFLLFSRCIYASVGACRFDVDLTATTKYTIHFDGTIGSVKTSYFENQHVCALSIRGGNVRIDSNCTIGGNCTYGIFAQSGLMWKNGDVSWIKNATTPEREHEGGRIFGRNEYSWTEIPYQNGWSTASELPLKFRSQGGIGMLYGWVTKTPIDTTIISKLPTGILPVNTQRFTVSAGGTSNKQDATLNIAANGDISMLNVGNITTDIIVISVTFPLA